MVSVQNGLITDATQIVMLTQNVILVLSYKSLLETTWTNALQNIDLYELEMNMSKNEHFAGKNYFTHK